MFPSIICQTSKKSKFLPTFRTRVPIRDIPLQRLIVFTLHPGAAKNHLEKKHHLYMIASTHNLSIIQNSRMFGSRKKFSSTSLGKVHNYTSYKEAITPKRKRGAGEVTLVVVCILLVLLMGKYLVAFARSAADVITRGAIGAMSTTMGDDIKKDTFGNTNIMIVGYGGANHAGGNLADSIMVASINPKL